MQIPQYHAEQIAQLTALYLDALKKIQSLEFINKLQHEELVELRQKVKDTPSEYVDEFMVG